MSCIEYLSLLHYPLRHSVFAQNYFGPSQILAWFCSVLSSFKTFAFVLVGKGKNESMIVAAWEHNSPWLTGRVFLSKPFNNGLVTVMVPQLRRENSLLLWNVFDLNTPVHTFVGHDDVVLEFQWRKQKEGEFRVECSLFPALWLTANQGCGDLAPDCSAVAFWLLPFLEVTPAHLPAPHCPPQTTAVLCWFYGSVYRSAALFLC